MPGLVTAVVVCVNVSWFPYHAAIRPHDDGIRQGREASDGIPLSYGEVHVPALVAQEHATGPSSRVADVQRVLVLPGDHMKEDGDLRLRVFVV